MQTQEGDLSGEWQEKNALLHWLISFRKTWTWGCVIHRGACRQSSLSLISGYVIQDDAGVPTWAFILSRQIISENI